MSTNDEQYRAGFEAWFEAEYPKDEEGNRTKYRNTMVMDLMRSAWAAAKREASTEPSDWRERAARACENESVDDSTGTEGDVAYNHAIRDCKAAIRALDAGAGALTDDATDAARYRWLRDEGCNFVWAEIGAGNFRSGLDEAIDERMARDAAIAEHTKPQEFGEPISKAHICGARGEYFGTCPQCATAAVPNAQPGNRHE